MQKFIDDGVQRQKFSTTITPIQVSAQLISLRSANSLLCGLQFLLKIHFYAFLQKYRTSFKDLDK
jgi:hypothetical protein